MRFLTLCRRTLCHLRILRGKTKGFVDTSEADVMVSVGRGIEEEENSDLLFDLAEAMDATVLASHPIIDNSWLPDGLSVA